MLEKIITRAGVNMPAPITQADIDRFWGHVRKTSDCWEWQAARMRGWGRFKLGRRVVQAHRFAYELLVGAIPEGLTLDHLCRNRACVNPDHLDPVTIRENVLRGMGPSARSARRTHCVHGHEYNLANTNFYASGRSCRICQRERYELTKRRDVAA